MRVEDGCSARCNQTLSIGKGKAIRENRPIFVISDLHIGDRSPKDNLCHAGRETLLESFLDYVTHQSGQTACHAAQWRLGLFHWNPDDPSAIVEHRYGMGVTLNLARPASWVLLSVPALIGVGSIAFMVVAG